MTQVSGAMHGRRISRPVSENLLILLLACTAGLVFLDRFGIAFVFPQISSELKLGNAQLGSLMGITAVTWAISSIVFSYLSDRLGGRPKVIMISCMIGFSLMTGFIGIATSYTEILILRGLMGVFEGPMIPLIQSSAAKSSSPHRVGRNLGIVIAGTTLFGTALAPIIMEGLAQTGGWRSAFYVLAAPGFVLAIALLFTLPPDAKATESKDIARPSLSDAASLLKRRNVLLGTLGAMTHIGHTLAFVTFFPIFLLQSVNLDDGTRITTLTAFGVAAALGAAVAPALSDRFPRKTCLLFATASASLAAALVAMSPGTPLLLFPALLFFAFGAGAFTLIVYIIPGASVPVALTATTFALLLAVGEMIGGLAGPSVGGLLADAFGLQAAIWFASGLAALSFLIGLAMQEPERLPGRSAQSS